MLKVHSKPHFALPPNVGHWQQNVDFNVVDVASEIYATDGYSGDGGNWRKIGLFISAADFKGFPGS